MNEILAPISNLRTHKNKRRENNRYLANQEIISKIKIQEQIKKDRLTLKNSGVRQLFERYIKEKFVTLSDSPQIKNGIVVRDYIPAKISESENNSSLENPEDRIVFISLSYGIEEPFHEYSGVKYFEKRVAIVEGELNLLIGYDDNEKPIYSPIEIDKLEETIHNAIQNEIQEVKQQF